MASARPVGGILRFTDGTAGVAGVGARRFANDATFPACRQPGGINTETEIRLPVDGQAPRFIDELFLDIDTPDFVGSGLCAASQENGSPGPPQS